jgi:ethanolamine utilization protein EutA
MAEPDPPRKTHTLADHMFGFDSAHAHDEDADHEHDDSGHDVLPIDSRALESVPFVSIGLDIGSSGTQVAFSRLLMRGSGEPQSLRRLVRERETLYLSPVSLTPFRPDSTIDIERLRDILDAAYNESGVTPDDIETGAIILTGEAAKRDNARAIADALSEESGELVCAAAGHHMEAMLAAHGSGAVRLSREKQARILNIDIGGGTTKLAICHDGRVTQVAALTVGGRCIAFDEDGRIVRMDEAGRAHARRAGFDWNIGDVVSPEQLRAVTDGMADALAAVLRGDANDDLRGLFVTDPIEDFGRIDGVLASGGVAEFIYGRETRSFGDLGLPLGHAIAQRLASGVIGWPLLPPQECIRATVLGASEYSMQMSGQTSTITSHADLLPRRNLQVLHPPFDFSGTIDPHALAQAIRRHREAFDQADLESEAAYAFRWRGEQSHERLRALAEGVAEGLADRIAAKLPIYILMEGDAALSLGAILRQELKVESEILVIDGIVLRDFDFVDIGRMRVPSGMVPVTVKSLLFAPEQKKSLLPCA